MTPRRALLVRAIVVATLNGGAVQAADSETGDSSPRFGVNGGVGLLTIARSTKDEPDNESSHAHGFAVSAAFDAEWRLGALGIGPRLGAIGSGTVAPLTYGSVDLSLKMTLPLLEQDAGGVRAMLGAGPAVATTFEPPSFGVKRSQTLPIGWTAFTGFSVVVPSRGPVRPTLELRVEGRSLAFKERMTAATGDVAVRGASIASFGVLISGGLAF